MIILQTLPSSCVYIVELVECTLLKPEASDNCRACTSTAGSRSERTRLETPVSGADGGGNGGGLKGGVATPAVLIKVVLIRRKIASAVLSSIPVSAILSVTAPLLSAVTEDVFCRELAAPLRKMRQVSHSMGMVRQVE